MTKKRRHWIAMTAIGLGGAALLGTMLRPSAVEIDHARVDRGTLEVTVEEQGRTRARYRYTVAAPVTGRLLRTGFDEGDHIDSGTTLVTIAPPPDNSREETALRAALSAAEARRQEAHARLVEARSQLALAEGEAQRRSDLFEKGLVSIETRDLYAKTAEAAKARLDSAMASVAAANADVESASARLIGIDTTSQEAALTPVIAPVSGTVLRVYEESERVVQAGTPLFELGKGNELEIVVDFLTQDAVKIKVGDAIRLTGWGGSETLLGTVRYIEPGAFTKISTLGVEEQRVNVIGDIANAPPSLGAEFRVEAAVVVWKGANVLRVPTTAIFRRDGSWHAFVVDEGRARLRALEIGQRGVDFAQIIDGIDEGEVVILFPSDLIEDGVRVQADS